MKTLGQVYSLSQLYFCIIYAWDWKNKQITLVHADKMKRNYNEIKHWCRLWSVILCAKVCTLVKSKCNYFIHALEIRAGHVPTVKKVKFQVVINFKVKNGTFVRKRLNKSLQVKYTSVRNTDQFFIYQ